MQLDDAVDFENLIMESDGAREMSDAPRAAEAAAEQRAKNPNNRPEAAQNPDPKTAVAKQVTASPANNSADQANSASFVGNPDNLPVIERQTETSTPSQDIVSHAYQQLSTVLDEESMEDTALIVKELNTKINVVNDSIEQKMAPAVEDVFLLQQMFPAAGDDQMFVNSSATPQSPSGAAQPIALNDPLVNETPIEQPTGVLGLLFKLPRYLFDLKNLLIILVCMLVLAVVLKILNFVLNRVY